MSDLRKAAEMALEVMKYNRANGTPNMGAAIEALRQALAQPEQEPVAWMDKDSGVVGRLHQWKNAIPLYTAPPKREWQNLTDDEIKEIVGPWGDTPIKGYTRKLFDQIEAKLKEKNT